MKQSAEWVQEAWDKLQQKVMYTSKRIGSNFPHATENGQYLLEPAHWWTAGFWPGLLWLVHRESGDERLRKLAESCEDQLDHVLEGYYKLDHDIGFMWTLTSVAQYKLLGEEKSKQRALHAANMLCGRFNLKGQYIRAWNPWNPNEDNSGWAIIDCMMNMPLLYWASEETGDPRYKHIAMAHTDTVLTHFIREDGSVNHVVVFDPHTGEKLEVMGGQGFAPDSAWSRGSAWALYGMALGYMHTGEARYLAAAKRVAHFFIANLPEDHVPHWDFRLPEEIVKYRDTSAGACAASGLLLLARQVDPVESDLYRLAAEKILYSLYANYGTWDNEQEEGLLLHGTSHYPENRSIDVSLIYGDYYYAEGIAQLLGREQLFW